MEKRGLKNKKHKRKNKQVVTKLWNTKCICGQAFRKSSKQQQLYS